MSRFKIIRLLFKYNHKLQKLGNHIFSINLNKKEFKEISPYLLWEGKLFPITDKKQKEKNDLYFDPYSLEIKAFNIKRKYIFKDNRDIFKKNFRNSKFESINFIFEKKGRKIKLLGMYYYSGKKLLTNCEMLNGIPQYHKSKYFIAVEKKGDCNSEMNFPEIEKEEWNLLFENRKNYLEKIMTTVEFEKFQINAKNYDPLFQIYILMQKLNREINIYYSKSYLETTNIFLDNKKGILANLKINFDFNKKNMNLFLTEEDKKIIENYSNIKIFENKELRTKIKYIKVKLIENSSFSKDRMFYKLSFFNDKMEKFHEINFDKYEIPQII